MSYTDAQSNAAVAEELAGCYATVEEVFSGKGISPDALAKMATDMYIISCLDSIHERIHEIREFMEDNMTRRTR